MPEFWSKSVYQLQPYVPGEQPKIPGLIKLNTNENPYPPSPKALKALEATCTEALKLYPDPNSDLLKQAIATYHNIEPSQVFVGNGSDEVLAHTFQALLKHDKPTLFPDITYSFYPVYCNLYDITFKTVPLNSSFEIDVDDFNQDNGGIIFPNPNAPTGIALSLKKVEQLLIKHPNNVVVVDEAYIDFGGESATSLISKYNNLLVVQTLSKSRSLAGLRLGFAMGNKHLIEGLERVKNSFNSYPVDRLASAGGIAAIQDNAYFYTTCQQVIQTREWLTNALRKLGFEVLESSANFVFTQHNTLSAKYIAKRLRDEKIIVRHFSSLRIENFLRISIGTDDECKMLIHHLTDIVTK